MNIGILFGGRSEEHEVSCVSAHSIYTNINKEKYQPHLIGITKSGKFKFYDGDLERLLEGNWEDHASDTAVDILGNNGPIGIYKKEGFVELDCIFPVLHGPYGEDGRIQGILDYADIPYVGNGLIGSAICMDKAVSKDLLKLNQIPQTPYQILLKGEEYKTDEKFSSLNYPLFVKPANLGSSVGISRVTKPEDLDQAIDFAFTFDKKLVIEEGVNCREIECAVLEEKGEIYTSSLGELIVYEDFYDYDAKYKNNTTKLVIPADLPESIDEKIKDYAKRVFLCLECNSMARIDFFIDKDSGEIMVNEVNTMPGFTSISMYPKLLSHDGISYEELIDRLIRSAMEDYD